LSPDFRDLLSAFNAHGVDYLVVGAHALAAHGHVRATGDLDVWVPAEPADIPVPVLSATQLIRNKRSVGRPQDMADVDWLERNASK